MVQARTLPMHELMVGAQHPQLLPLLRQYAQLLGTMHDPAKAEEVEKRIATISAAAPNQR